MPFYPRLTESQKTRLMTERFLGYNGNLRIADGEFSEETNMSACDYPLLSPRKKRGVKNTLTSGQGLLAKEYLAYVDGSTLYYNGEAVEGITLSTAAEDCPKRLISMGAYILIFPDNKYYNTQNAEDYGDMGATFTKTVVSDVVYDICSADGTILDPDSMTTADTAPSNPSNGDMWIDTSTGTSILNVYSTYTALWTQVQAVYTRISCTGIGASFKEYDGVTIAGCAYAGDNEKLGTQIIQINGDKMIYARGDDYIVVVGVLDASYTQATGTITIARKIPPLDFVTESENRLWGCHYGQLDGEMVNEIYACKQGDFKNWRCYMGLSTDSYAVSLGSDGEFTGAITYLGYPMFFKRNCVHKIMGAQPSNYQVMTTQCRGVQPSSEKSLVIVDETLFYKSDIDVCAFDGSLPTGVSDALSDMRYTNAVAGALGETYYISMQDADGAHHLFTYDTRRGIWHREDNLNAMDFAALDGELYCLHADSGEILSMTGREGTLENRVKWRAVTGLIGYEYPNRKYLSRFNIRLQMSANAVVSLEIEYDSSGIWERKGSSMALEKMTKTILFPIIPKRCDHMRIRLSGVGEVKLYSIARILETGGDGAWRTS